jgi:hypothetical protein
MYVNSYLGKLFHSDLVSLPNNPHFHRRNINFHNYTLLTIFIIEQTSTFHLRRPYTFTLRITGRQGMSVDVVCIVNYPTKTRRLHQNRISTLSVNSHSLHPPEHFLVADRSCQKVIFSKLLIFVIHFLVFSIFSSCYGQGLVKYTV